MPAALLARDEVVARIHTVFRELGFDGASLSAISKATGLGKGSLYHYFAGGKDEMAIAVIDRIDTWMNEHLVAIARGSGTPQQRLRTILRTIDDFYEGGRNACVLGNLVVGASGETFASQLHASFDIWIGALRTLAVEAGVRRSEAQHRAEDALALIEGALILSSARNDTATFKRALRSVERQLVA